MCEIAIAELALWVVLCELYLLSNVKRITFVSGQKRKKNLRDDLEIVKLRRILIFIFIFFTLLTQ